ncbi:acyl-CoA thioester hydrolase/BAAT C-terminal domain-containing protein [Acidaminobacter sp. JC074]|uniref:acyl-CoA thioesterase/bile acid-CoA:amino acid N-acyltransferase family protein n=1 Tax=Acidaminobacter sp. JC074 TaxID=2530199 RepID=UPI001F0D937B|nr:acyl-CoA thioester hydrolase/BAAT C-terminal domain-containing protein [Acidaminobacter sp. JC074]
MKIQINQKEQVLLGDPIYIRIETEALEDVQIYLRRFYHDGDIDYSYGVYEPVNGVVDTHKSKPIGGMYSKADVSGLFWSMESATMDYDLDLSHLDKLSEEDMGYYIIDIFQNDLHEVYRFKVIRNLPEVKVKALDDISAKFFYIPSDEPLPVMIHVAGEEGIEGVEVNARLLASKGIATLALPICGYGNLPGEFKELPLENILRSIDYMKKIPIVDENRIGIMGGTRGAELALKIASMRSDLKVLIAANPCDVINQSVVKQITTSKSSWTYEGKPVSFSKVNKLELMKLYAGRILFQKTYAMKPCYNHENAMIDTSKIRAKTLLLAGKHDERWDSVMMAGRIKQGLDCTVKTYEAGQILGGPGCLPTTSFQQLSFSLGGTPEGNGISQNASWHDIIDFIRDNL